MASNLSWSLSGLRVPEDAPMSAPRAPSAAPDPVAVLLPPSRVRNAARRRHERLMMETPIPLPLPTAPVLAPPEEPGVGRSAGSSGARAAEAAAVGAPKSLADVAVLSLSSRTSVVPGLPALFAPLYDFLSDSLTAAQPDGEPAIVDAQRSHLSLLFSGPAALRGSVCEPVEPEAPGG